MNNATFMPEYLKIVDEYSYDEYELPVGELRAILDNTDDPHLKNLIQTEIDCLNFGLAEGKLQSIFSTTDKTGMIIKEYPSISNFDTVAIQYLISRLYSTPNKRLRVRYGQILWNSKERNRGKYAQHTIDTYLDLVKNSNP